MRANPYEKIFSQRLRAVAFLFHISTSELRDFTIYDATGVAIQDLAAASLVYRPAEEQNIGQLAEFLGTFCILYGLIIFINPGIH